MPGRTLRVVAGLWRRSNTIFLAQRNGGPLDGMWELPGGKQELGERAPAALQRELKEELGVGVEVGPEWAVVEERDDDRKLVMRVFQVRSEHEPKGLEGQATGWFDAERLVGLPMPPADELLRQRLIRAAQEPAPNIWEASFVWAQSVGERTERALWMNGVLSAAELLDPAFDEGIDGVLGKAGVRSVRHHLKDLPEDPTTCWRAVPARLRWRLLEPCHERSVAIDFECSKAGDPTALTVVRAGGEALVFLPPEALAAWTAEAERVLPGRCVAGAPGSLDGEPLTLLPFADLSDYLGPEDLLLTFGGKRFDKAMLYRVLDAEAHPRDHFDLLDLCRRLRLRGGLKAVERSLGIERDARIASLQGRQAMALWARFESGGDQGIWALADLIAYNRADAVNLFALRDRLLTRARLRFGFPDWYLRG